MKFSVILTFYLSNEAFGYYQLDFKTEEYYNNTRVLIKFYKHASRNPFYDRSSIGHHGNSGHKTLSDRGVSVTICGALSKPQELSVYKRFNDHVLQTTPKPPSWMVSKSLTFPSFDAMLKY